MERKILLLEHVNYFAINRFSPIMTGIYILVLAMTGSHQGYEWNLQW